MRVRRLDGGRRPARGLRLRVARAPRDAAVINELYVRPAHRGTGLADGLFERALDVAAGQSLPLDRVVLDVDGANDRARAFYERYGFEPWGELVARAL